METVDGSVLEANESLHFKLILWARFIWPDCMAGRAYFSGAPSGQIFKMTLSAPVPGIVYSAALRS